MTRSGKTSPLIFFGTESLSGQFLTLLIDAGYDIAAVITKPDSKKGRGHTLTEPLVKTIARHHHIPVWQPSRLTDIASDIRALQPVAGVLVSYGNLIPSSIIDLFTPGIINVHPSLLPRYRGPSPIESALLHGDHETGVSIMQLVPKMDAGPLYAQQTVALKVDQNKAALYKTLSAEAGSLLLRVLPDILDGTLLAAPQSEHDATYCHLLTKADGILDPTTMTAQEAERRVRALLDFPKTRLDYRGQSIIVTAAHVDAHPQTNLDQQYQDGAYLIIDELISPTSGKKMSAEAYLNGHSS